MATKEELEAGVRKFKEDTKKAIMILVRRAEAFEKEYPLDPRFLGADRSPVELLSARLDDFEDYVQDEIEGRINGLTGLLERVVDEARVDRRRLHYELSEFERKLAELEVRLANVEGPPIIHSCKPVTYMFHPRQWGKTKGETNGKGNDEGAGETVTPEESDVTGAESGIAKTD